MPDSIKYRYFSLGEFDSPDTPGSGARMDPDFMWRLDEMRHECGFPFKVNSGVRTLAHNESVGGVGTSDHLIQEDGYAHGADIECLTSAQRFKIVDAAIMFGIHRIGIAKTFIHLGNWRGNPKGVIWLY